MDPRAPSQATRWSRVEHALVVLIFAWLGVHTLRLVVAAWPFTTDDAYITLRYARHLAEGRGIVWNVGASIPVEGYSNFLFVILGALALVARVDPVVVLKGLSCLALIPTCAMLYVLARQWLRPIAATLPAVFLIGHPGAVFWAVSGLETSVFILLVVAATTAFVIGLDAPLDAPTGGRMPCGSRGRLHIAAAVFAFLAALCRPEAPLLCAVLGVTGLLHSGLSWLRARRVADVAARVEVRRALFVTVRAFTLAFVVPYAAYFLWRYVHFGRLLPNTVYCKSAFSESPDPWKLLRDFWAEGRVFILLALVQNPRKLGVRALPLFLLPMAYAVILRGADPVIGQHSRHFLGALALLLVASSAGAVNLATLVTLPVRLVGRIMADGGAMVGRVVAVAADVTLVAASLVLVARSQAWVDDASPRACAHDLADHKAKWLLAPPVDLAYHASCYASRMDARADLGRYLDSELSPDQTYVLGDTGIAPYITRANVIDAFCLNAPEMTRPPISFDRGRFIDSIFERSPDMIVVQSLAAQRFWPQPEYGFYPALARDERFRDRYELRREAPVFHSKYRGEGLYYLVYERRTDGP